MPVWLFGEARYSAVRAPSCWRGMLHGSDGVAIITRADGWDCIRAKSQSQRYSRTGGGVLKEFCEVYCVGIDDYFWKTVTVTTCISANTVTTATKYIPRQRLPKMPLDTSATLRIIDK